MAASVHAFNDETQHFVVELDQAVQCHMAWTRRVLRCAVLHASPGDDVLADNAHRICDLGLWLRRHRGLFAEFDRPTARRLRRQHQQLHDSARRICLRILAGGPADADELNAFERAQVGVVADLARLKTVYLAHSARLDPLTGLPLRYSLEDEFQRCHAQAMRHGELLVALMLDLDRFKQINDAQGHAVGDLALRHVAALLRSQCRTGEPVFRYGGEEFVALMQAVDRAAAQRAAERILQALRDNPMQLPDGSSLDVRASAGIAEVGRSETMAAALGRADRALYASKAAGRDTWNWAAGADQDVS